MRSPIYLLAGATREHQEAELIDGVDDNLLKLADNEWQAFLQLILEARCAYNRLPGQAWMAFVKAAYGHAVAQRVSLDDLPEHPHWTWQQKPKGPNCRIYGVQCNDSIQGLMFAVIDKLGRMTSKAGQPIVYIDYVATAPWNDTNLGIDPRFRGSGLLLIRAAVQLSLDLGRDGVIGLHALPKAEDFYRNPRKCRLIDLGEDPYYGNMHYFEMHPTIVSAFMNPEGGKL